MKSDSSIQKKVREELDFDPSVEAENIGVAVKDGIVILSGTVPTYAAKLAAEKSAFRVAGVRGVAEEIDVRLEASHVRTDSEIAKAAADAIAWNASVPSTVSISVEHGRIILRGTVEWQYQREAAGLAVRYLRGLTGIVNHIRVAHRPQAVDIRQIIEKALLRSAQNAAKKIDVAFSDGTVTLSGQVHSASERDDALFAAWAVPGVEKVDNKIILDR